MAALLDTFHPILPFLVCLLVFSCAHVSSCHLHMDAPAGQRFTLHLGQMTGQMTNFAM